MTASDVPIVCTLHPNEVAGRLQEYEELFGEHLRAIERHPRRLRLLLHPAAGVEAAVRDQLAREQECCPFLTFHLTPGPDTLVADLEVPAEAEQGLDGFVWIVRKAAPNAR